MNTSVNKSIKTTSYHQNWVDSSMPVHVQFRHMRESAAIIYTAKQMAAKLEKYQLEGASCTVVIDEAHHRHHSGIFQVTARLCVPGEKLYVARSSRSDVMRDDLHAAVANVFEGLDHQLVKAHNRKVWRKNQTDFAESDAA